MVIEIFGIQEDGMTDFSMQIDLILEDGMTDFSMQIDFDI